MYVEQPKIGTFRVNELNRITLKLDIIKIGKSYTRPGSFC